jgi:hypothetical protein
MVSSTSLGTLDKLPLELFVKFLETVLIEDIVSECQRTA